MKILFASSEAVPFAVSGGLAEVAGALPKALRAKGEDVRVILPLYGSVTEEQRAEMKYLLNFDVAVAWRRQYCGVFEAKVGDVTYYLLDNEYYFKRSGLYGYYDDAERFAFFSRAVLDTVQHLEELDGFKPDIIHCNDWQTALIPVYYNCFYREAPGYENIRTVYTIHNIQYQGMYGMDILSEVVGLEPQDYYIVENDGLANFSKGAIECCNKVTTVPLLCERDPGPLVFPRTGRHPAPEPLEAHRHPQRHRHGELRPGERPGHRRPLFPEPQSRQEKGQGGAGRALRVRAPAGRADHRPHLPAGLP